MVKIEYNTSENDGIIYDNNETFIIRIEGRLVEYEPGQNKESYINFNESRVTLNSYPVMDFVLECGALPRYMIEKLNLGLAHEVFKVNDIEYQSEDTVDSELLKDSVTVTNMYKGKTNIQLVDYENYTAAADDVEPTTHHILIDETGAKLQIKDQGIEYFTRYKD